MSAHQRIRILFLIDSIANHAGTENQLVEIIKRIDQSRFEVHLGCLEESSRMLELAAFCRTVVFPIRSLYSPAGLRAAFNLRAYLNRQRIDIVQTFMIRANILGVFAARWSRCSAIIASRRNLGYWFTPGYRFLFRYLNNHTTRLLANSEGARRAAIEFERVRPEKVDVLYNGVDMAAFNGSRSNSGFRQLIGIPPTVRVVGMVANLRPVKDYPLFLRAAQIVARRIPDVVFLLVGRGPLKEELRALAAELGISAKVFITDGQGEVVDALHTMSLAGLSSSSEGFSNAILEYMAARLPVVATDVGGNREAVEHGITGYIVADRTPEAFAQPLIELLENERLRLEMSQAGYERCRLLFDMEVAVRHHERYYTLLSRSVS